MTFGEVLTPVRERYAFWLGLDADQVDEDRQEAPEEVRAIQIVLHMEKSATPSHHRALELAASGCALLCLDERSTPGGEWHDAVLAYGGVHIRKVTRRARGAAWEATADLPGITLADGDTEVRVLVPGLVTELDKRISRLQVSGTDLERDAPSTDAPAGPLLTCAIPVELGMTTGKLMAQTGHAAMIAAALAADTDPDLLRAWYVAGCPARVEPADQSGWADLRGRLTDPAAAWRDQHLLAVRDGGFTEVDPGTVTVVATFSDRP